MARWSGRLPFLLMVLISVLLVTGVLTLYLRLNSQQPLEVLLPTPTSIVPKEIKVYLTGAVSRQGVYALREGDRLEDAIRAAGGTTSEADLLGVNPALRVKDEGHYHVPRQGEAFTPLPLGTPNNAGKVNINAAIQRELEGLPGIGEVRAKAIIDYRRKNGPFLKPEDLMKVEGIGSGIYQRLKDLITVQ